MSMKTAEELQALAKQKASEQIANALDGAKEHMIKRCQKEAEKGLYKYMFTSKGVHETILIDLLYEFINIAHEFEKYGYVIDIEAENSNPCYSYLYMYINWSKHKYVRRDFKPLYSTTNGINYNNLEKLKENILCQ